MFMVNSDIEQVGNHFIHLGHVEPDIALWIRQVGRKLRKDGQIFCFQENLIHFSVQMKYNHLNGILLQWSQLFFNNFYYSLLNTCYVLLTLWF